MTSRPDIPERPLWCPICYPRCWVMAWGATSFGQFGAHVRERHDPLWRRDADRPGWPERVAELVDIVEADRTGSSLYGDDPFEALHQADMSARQSALAELRVRYATDPAAAAWLREIEDQLESEYEEGRFMPPDPDEDCYE